MQRNFELYFKIQSILIQFKFKNEQIIERKGKYDRRDGGHTLAEAGQHAGIKEQAADRPIDRPTEIQIKLCSCSHS